MEGYKKGRMLTALELSAFCTQVNLMLTAGIPLYEGLDLMAEDSKDETERNMLKELADEMELGATLYKVRELSESFPKYVIYMTRIGEESGNLDHIMESLAEYYKREDTTKKMIKDAITYPIIMVFMMLIILYILMTKVMPVFEGVFSQLGTELSPFATNAVSLGGLLSGICILLIVVIVVISGVLVLLAKNTIKLPFLQKLMNYIDGRSKISSSLEISRFCSVVSIMLQSGMEVSEILTLAKAIVRNQTIHSKVSKCEETYQDCSSFVDALKETGFFDGFHKQMIVVGDRTGHLDSVLKDLSDRYNEDVYIKVNRAIAKFEPTLVAVLSVAVGLILLAVMLPLIGMMSSMG